MYGATFVDHNTHTVLNGSRFGKEFSANALHAWFNDPAQKPIVQQPTYNQGQQSQQSQSHPNDEYFQPTLPGLELFHVGSGYDPEQEAMNREMERRKRKRKRKGRRL